MATTSAGNPYQPGPSAPGSAQPTNGLGIAGFVLSLIGLVTCGALNVISLPLSLFALARKPRGLAIAGVLISTLGLVLLAAVGISFFAAAMGFRVLADAVGRDMETHSAISDAKNAIESYRAENSTLPDGIEGNKLVVEKKDGWGTELRYEQEDGSYLIRSAGQDKQFNTADDVTSKDLGGNDVETNLDIDIGEGMEGDGPVTIPDGTSSTIELPDTSTPTTPESSDDSE